jgi:5-bromo-4-chloroindolyl phosphate hydrolysis protein
MNDLLRKGRAWAPVLKAAALFVLPMPLSFAVLAALISGDMVQLLTTSGALACLWSAGMLSWRALVAEARYFLGERADPPALPLKAISTALTALGAGLTATAGGHGLVSAAVFGALAGVGYVCFYGRDVKPHRVEVANIEGIDAAAVTATLKQAYGRLRGIEAAARDIAVPEFGARLSRIIDIGRGILQEIERDPRDASRARRFLNIYLDSAERVTSEYARTHRQLRSRPLEQNFRQLLIDMESTFEAQQRKLLENDLTSLDVEIEVLNARLTREGVN